MQDCIIKISNTENSLTWQKALSFKEFKEVEGYCKAKESRNTVAVIPAVLMPVRTNTACHFAQDFFLPTTLNHAIKIKSLAIKFFAFIAALLLDLITLPIRILTCIPRAIINGLESKHPLLKYLKKQGVDPKLVESDHVKCKLVWATPSKHRIDWSKQQINFIDLPKYEGCDELPTSGFTSSHSHGSEPSDEEEPDSPVPLTPPALPSPVLSYGKAIQADDIFRKAVTSSNYKPLEKLFAISPASAHQEISRHGIKYLYQAADANLADAIRRIFAIKGFSQAAISPLSALKALSIAIKEGHLEALKALTENLTNVKVDMYHLLETAAADQSVTKERWACYQHLYSVASEELRERFKLFTLDPAPGTNLLDLDIALHYEGAEIERAGSQST